MSRVWTATEMSAYHDKIKTLEDDRASNLATFTTSSSGLSRARRMLANLTSALAPDNLTTSHAVTLEWRRAVDRLGRICNG